MRNSFVEHLRETGAVYYDPAKTPRFAKRGELKPVEEFNGMVLFYDDVSGWGEIRKDGETICRGGHVHNHMWNLVKEGWNQVNGEWRKP
jgi:hypothetical protein